ncbi:MULTISPECIES: CD3324 family protein [unclassified Lysinibacillus]|uniref:CD3324 family protein n=1 Tax=unclassified Lysinibacillus TaxID=2636778 RepID=UPI0030F6F3AE
MSYKKANNLLPAELIALIQNYVDGEYIYIPRRQDSKKSWGAGTTTRNELDVRNNNIYQEYLSGTDMETLSATYYLSLKSIQRIILKEKRKRTNI